MSIIYLSIYLFKYRQEDTGVWSFVCFCQVFDGAVIVLSLAPMVASTVANGPSSPWDAISLIITLRIWRVKRIIDGQLLYDNTPFTGCPHISWSLKNTCAFSLPNVNNFDP